MRRACFVAALAAILTAHPGAAPALAGGISADAGLTPPQGRWILRSQLRLMAREAPDGGTDMSMDRLVVPLVVVHGATPALTLGVRQTFDSRSMKMGGEETTRSGFGDLYAFTKYKVLRVNTRDLVLGLSPVLGVELPTGSDEVSGNAVSLNAGFYASARAGFWAADVNLDYGMKGIAGVDAAEPAPGNELGVVVAFARQIPLGASGEISLAPVLETAWQSTDPSESDGQDLPNSGEDVFSLAPGLKYTAGDLIVEGLVRFPVAQEQNGMQTEMGTMFLVGVRRMF